MNLSEIAKSVKRKFYINLDTTDCEVVISQYTATGSWINIITHEVEVDLPAENEIREKLLEGLNAQEKEVMANHEVTMNNLTNMRNQLLAIEYKPEVIEVSPVPDFDADDEIPF